jgi:hypothetical protein
MGKTIGTFMNESFTNDFGETIKPGDKVVFTTSSWMVRMQQGLYCGYFLYPNGSKRAKVTCTKKLWSSKERGWNTVPGHTVLQNNLITLKHA